MNKQQLFENIKKKQSFLCVGLDTDIKKIPQHLLSEEDPIFAFNKAIIDATADYCVAYKPNLAFYESLRIIPINLSSPTRNVVISEIPPRCMPVLSSIISR